MNRELHRYTPTLAAVCPRGLPVLSVAYHREAEAAEARARIERRSFDAAGRRIAQWDARLWADGNAAGAPSQRSIHDLSARVLRHESADGGWYIALSSDTGDICEGWDGRGTHRLTGYDPQLRRVSVEEKGAGIPARCVERFTYGDVSEAATNRCGRMIRQDDPAGCRTLMGSSVLGGDLAQTQRFLKALETPNWPLSIAERDALLEMDGQNATVAYTTHWTYDAIGTTLVLTDAVGNARHMHYDMAGQVSRMSLKAMGAIDATNVLHTVDYNALAQLITHTAGNDVVSTATYAAADGRLQRLQVARPGKLLQDLHYDHDPVGNVLRVADDVAPTDWFNGEQVDPVNMYRYDTLYQLIQASGRESLSAGIHPELPGPVLPGGGDASRRRNFTQTYNYDAGGNLLTLGHTQVATRVMHVDARSNRSLLMTDADHPPDIAGAFDANGNLLKLEGAQTITWDLRNQLQRVTQVARGDGSDDDEVYVYGGGGRRLRKVRVRQGKAVLHLAEVKYLPGLEIRTDTATGEVLHVATVQAGRSEQRHLNWREGRLATAAPQWRYSLADHLGNSTLELDHHGEVISYEGYYPFGGTAWWAVSSSIEASRKVVRYSGKERDATGLYYYGYRYYAPWIQRWINPDPAGDADGLNRFGFVRNNPMSSRDEDGRWRSPGGTEYPPDDPFFAMEAAAELPPRAQPVELVNMGYDGPPSVAPVELVNMGYDGTSVAPDELASAGYAPALLLPPTVHSLTSFIDRLGASRAAASPAPSMASISTTAALDDALDLASEYDLGEAAVAAGDVSFPTLASSGSAGISRSVPMGPPAAPLSGTSGYPCPANGCSFVGKNWKTRRIHWRQVHDKETNFLCPHCGKPFLTSSALKQHESTHSTTRDFVCETCGKAFHRQLALDQHKATHEPTQVACTYAGCTKTYKSARGLNAHIGTVHKNIRHACPACSFTAASTSYLNVHRRTAGH